MKKIAILSGKGGVGKSSITASLAVAMSRDKTIVCADCDVDASNLSLVLGIKPDQYKEWLPLSTNQKIIIDYEKCNSCKKCVDACYFNAIGWKDNLPYLKEYSCEGCGVCVMVCPKGAISMISIDNAKIGYATTKYGFDVVSAQLGIGESGSGKVVAEVKKKVMSIGKNADIMLIDSAAGIGCPVISSVSGSDYAVIVTEPTPSGYSDMQRAYNVVTHFGIKCGLILNKSNINEDFNNKIKEFAKANNIKVIEEIPYDRAFVDALVNMVPIIEHKREYDNLFTKIVKEISGQLE